MNFCFQTTYNESFFFQKRNNWKKKKKILPLPFFLFGQNKTMTLFCVAVIANDDQKPTFSGDSRFSVFSHSSTQTKRHDFFIAKLDDAREEKCYWHWALLNALIRRENTLRETKKKYLLSFFFFFVWSTDGSDPTESDRWMLCPFWLEVVIWVAKSWSSIS